MAENEIDFARQLQNRQTPATPVYENVQGDQGSGGFNFAAHLEGQKQINVAAQNQLGANFDPENFAPFWVRLSIARGDNLEEMNLRLRREYPEGEVRPFSRSVMEPDAPEGTFMMFRESPDSQWKFVEPPGTIDWTDVGELLAPSAEALTGETIMSLATPPQARIPALVGRMALGATAGEATEQAVQSARGLQAQTPTEVFTEPLVEGAASALGGFATSPFVGARNAITGRGILSIGDEGMETLRVAKELGIGDLMTPGLVSDNPIVQASERQAVAVLPDFRRRYGQIIRALDDALGGRVDPQALRRTLNQVTGSLDRYSDEFISRLNVQLRNASTGGEAVQAGIREYGTVSKNIVDRLYGVARQIEEPQFDLTSLTNLAQDLRAGSKGTINPQVEALLQDIENITGPRPLSPGPNGEQRFLSVTDQLRNVRTEAGALSHVPPGGIADQTVGQAADLRRALTKVLDNPTNTTPGFRDAWRQASAAASERFTTLEKAVVIQSARSQNPAELLRYAQPGQIENLRTLRDTLDHSRWMEFTDAWRTEVIRNPNGILNTIDSFDQETLDVLMPRSEQALWRRIGTETNRIAEVGAGEMAERQVSAKNFIDSLITGAEPRDAVTVFRALRREGPQAVDDFRAGMIDWAWDGAVRVDKNGLSVDRNLLQRRVDTLKRNGLLRFLDQDTKAALESVDAVVRSLQSVLDAGTSIRGMEITSGITRLKASAWLGLLQSGMVSQFYLSRPGRLFLIGTGRESSRGEILRLYGAALAQVGANQQSPEDLREELNRREDEMVR